MHVLMSETIKKWLSPFEERGVNKGTKRGEEIEREGGGIDQPKP